MDNKENNSPLSGERVLQVKSVEERHREEQTEFIPKNWIAPEGYEYYRSHAMDSDICIRPIKS